MPPEDGNNFNRGSLGEDSESEPDILYERLDDVPRTERYKIPFGDTPNFEDHIVSLDHAVRSGDINEIIERSQDRRVLAEMLIEKGEGKEFLRLIISSANEVYSESTGRNLIEDIKELESGDISQQEVVKGLKKTLNMSDVNPSLYVQVAKSLFHFEEYGKCMSFLNVFDDIRLPTFDAVDAMNCGGSIFNKLGDPQTNPEMLMQGVELNKRALNILSQAEDGSGVEEIVYKFWKARIEHGRWWANRVNVDTFSSEGEKGSSSDVVTLDRLLEEFSEIEKTREQVQDINHYWRTVFERGRILLDAARVKKDQENVQRYIDQAEQLLSDSAEGLLKNEYHSKAEHAFELLVDLHHNFNPGHVRIPDNEIMRKIQQERVYSEDGGFDEGGIEKEKEPRQQAKTLFEINEDQYLVKAKKQEGGIVFSLVDIGLAEEKDDQLNLDQVGDILKRLDSDFEGRTSGVDPDLSRNKILDLDQTNRVTDDESENRFHKLALKTERSEELKKTSDKISGQYSLDKVNLDESDEFCYVAVSFGELKKYKDNFSDSESKDLVEQEISFKDK